MIVVDGELGHCLVDSRCGQLKVIYLFDCCRQVKAFTVRWGPVVEYSITLITGGQFIYDTF